MNQTFTLSFLSALFLMISCIPMASADSRVKSSFETASFGLGWFWGIESQFGIIDGVIRTRVGYAGGSHPKPSYRRMGDHTETVQIDYDPQKISYEQLLKIFWDSHNPERRAWSAQYKNAIFFGNEHQKKLALGSKSAMELSSGNQVGTDVVPLVSFTAAEDYHQKYLLKQHALNRQIAGRYPDHHSLVDATEAARLNGYAGGYGTRETLDRDRGRLGLGSEGQKILENLITE